MFPRPIQPYTADAPDTKCAKGRATDRDHAQNARERARVSSINKKTFFLMACRLSENALKCREFFMRAWTSFYIFGDMKLLNSTHLTLRSGYFFVVANKLKME